MNVIDVGTPSEDFKDWTSTVVRFHGFANLTTTRNDYVESPEFSCFGHHWRLDLYPGGEEDSPEGYIAIELGNRSNTSIKISYGYSVRDANCKEVVHIEPQTDEFAALGGSNAWCSDFAKRTKLLELLVQGSLVIDVRMKLLSTGNNATQFIPTNPLSKNVLELFMDEETADVVFEVGEENNKRRVNARELRHLLLTFMPTEIS